MGLSENSENSEDSENSETSEASESKKGGEGAEIGKGVCPRGAEADAPLPTRLLSGRALPSRLGKPSGALGKFGKFRKFGSFGGGIKKGGEAQQPPRLGVYAGLAA